MSPDITIIIKIIISILASAFFSGMEIAFISSNKLQIELNRKQGYIYAKALSLNINNSSRFIASMLVGNNIALVIYGIYMALILTPMLDYIKNDVLILLLQTIISTFFILITAEFLPKTIFQAKANFFLKIFSIPASLINILLYPLVSIILVLSKIILGKNQANTNKIIFGKTDLDNFIKDHTENLETNNKIETEIEIFKNALDFAEIKIRECMVPRTEIIAVPLDTEINEVRKLFIKTGHSKILIYKKSIDKVIGYLHMYDLFKNPEKIKKSILPISFFPETMGANEVLNNFIKQKRNIAVVLDEFGGTAGMITIEDVIEEIFGEIEDEHDTQDWIEKKINKYEFIFSARHEVDYLNKKYNLSLPEAENYETIGGLIFHHHQNIPKKGEKINIQNYTFEIINSSETHINTIKLNYNK